VDVTARFYEKLVGYRSPGIHVTALIYECLRRGYYSIAVGGQTYDIKTLTRFWIGNAIHAAPLLRHHELPVSFEGAVGTVDEYEDGVLVDKKHTSKSLPTSPNDHYVTQVEYYSVMLKSMGLPVDEAHIFYIDVTTPGTKDFKVDLRPTEKIQKELSRKIKSLQEAIATKTPPPRVVGWWCGYCNFASTCWRSEELTLHEGRWAKAQELANKELFKSIAIDEEQISAKFVTGEKEYALYMDDNEYFCSCVDHTTRKVMCKHLLALLIEVQEKIPKERFQKYLRRTTLEGEADAKEST
jgi:hypothetical protein